VVVTPTCSAPTINAATNGTFTIGINGVSYSGTIVNGILRSTSQGLNSGSGVVNGTVSGSSGGSDGLVLSAGLTLITGSASGTAVINGTTYNLTSNAVTKVIEYSCP
jgi:hypothetical protein